MKYRLFFEDKQISLSELFYYFDNLQNFPIEDRIAVFDFDNTLIHGDIGEAIFAKLLKENRIDSFTWTDYINLISSGKVTDAYKKIISSYQGMKKEDVLYYSEELISLFENDIDYFSFVENGKFYSVPKPAINKIFADIILKLQSLEFQIYIISASSEISVKYLGNRFFDIPEENIFGMKNKISDDGTTLSSEILEPAPCFDGKKELYTDLISEKRPLITAGDSENDFAFMSLTHNEGFKIFTKKIEDENNDFQRKLGHLKQRLNGNDNLISIENNF